MDEQALVDFSRLDLESISPEELENLYKDIHLPSQKDQVNTPDIPAASMVEHPVSMVVKVMEVAITEKVPDMPLSLRFMFRGKESKTPFVRDISKLYTVDHEFRLSYHSLLFDVLKIDVFREQSMFTSSVLGRVRIKLCALSYQSGQIIQQFIIYPKESYQDQVSCDIPSIGSITVLFTFLSSSLGISALDNGSLGSPVESVSFSDSTSGSADFIDCFHRAGYQESLSDQSGGRYRSCSSISSYSTLTDLIPTMYSKEKGSFFSGRTRSGIKELSEFAASFFKHGWPISKMDFVRAMILINKYFDNPRTNLIVQDTKFLGKQLYWLKYTVAAYGTFVMNWCGYGNGYILDKLKKNPNMKLAAQSLKLDKEDLLGWEIGNDEMFKPHFFVCRDRRTESIIISIRGTWSLSDALTDLCGEYEPFMIGYAHRGFLKCAKWIDEHYMDKIMGWINLFKVKKLYVVGHSLGGAIGSILTMISKEHFLPVLLENKPDFELHCCTFASPPAVSENLAEKYSDCIDSFINENDIVPRLSAGSIADFKEIVVSTASIANSKASSMEKLEAVDLLFKHKPRNSKNPKVFIAGKVYFMFKSTRAQSKFLNDNIEPNPSPANSNEHLEEKTQLPSNPLDDLQNPHYIVEEASRCGFTTLALKSLMIVHHFPSRYEKAIKKVSDLFDCLISSR